ncbi:MAG: hypothetical protein ACXWNX_00860, partial [Isosphaeraceae bacterium]
LLECPDQDEFSLAGTVGLSLADVRARADKHLEIHDVDRRDACPPVADMRAGLTGLLRQAPLPLNRNRNSP